MALQGTLDSFSLPDVLRLLADTGKTGRLHVEGDRGEGSVWIDGGSLVAADADGARNDASTDEVIFEMLRFGSGAFAFAAGDQPPTEGSPVDLEGVLRRAGELLDEWRELEAVVPSLDHQVAIAPQLTVDQVTIDASRWATLAAIAGGLTVAELGETLDQSELAILRTVSDLVELGIVVVQEPRKGAASRRARATNAPRRTAKEEPARPQAAPPPKMPQEEPPRRVPAARTNGRSVGPSEPQREERVPVARNRDRKPLKDSSTASLRRSRATGQRTPRQVGGHAAASHGAAVPALPSASPFSSGSMMPPQPGVPGVGGVNGAGSRQRPSGQHTPLGQQGLAGLPPFNNNEDPGLAPAPLDSGSLAPPALPAAGDTGQVPIVAASSLPADLSWAAEDDEAPLGVSPGGPPSPPMGTPPAPVGRSGAPLLAPGPGGPGVRPPLPGPDTGPMGPPGYAAEGDTAPHVAVLSPEARMAVESTIGPAGGGSGVVPAAGATPEEAQQRGALLGFLSSVRQ